MLANRALASAVRGSSRKRRFGPKAPRPAASGHLWLFQSRLLSEGAVSFDASKPERLRFRSVEKPSRVGPDGDQLSFSQARTRKAAGAASVFGAKATPEQISEGITSWLDDHKLEYKYAGTNSSQLIVKECPLCHDTHGKSDNQNKLYIYLDKVRFHCFRCNNSGTWYDSCNREETEYFSSLPHFAYFCFHFFQGPIYRSCE